MKVLITCLSRSWGGMEMYSLQTAEELVKSGLAVDLLCFPGSQLHLEAEKHGIRTHTLKFSNYFSPAVTIKLYGILKKEQYDIVHAEASKDLWLIVPALKFSSLKTPLIFTKHVGSYIVKRDLLHKWIYNRVDRALAISGVIMKNLIDTTPLTEDKIILLYDAIDVNKFNPEKYDKRKIRKEFNVGDNELLIGMNARFSPGKGHEEFLHSAKEITQQFQNIRFIAVGGPSKGEDDYAEEIKNLASELGLDEKVIFTGFRNDVPEILASMDIFVFPSHAEAFGLALVEAMSMKLPSVCSNTDGVLDIAVDHETSLLFQKADYHDLTEKLSELIKNPDERVNYGNAARKRAVDVFSMELITSKLISIYQEQIEDPVITAN